MSAKSEVLTKSNDGAVRKMKGERRRRSPKENDEMVFTILSKSDRPLTAYDLLRRLAAKGVSGPPTVYRALDRLIQRGVAHRLESLNAFVACARPHHRTSAIFAICRKCGTTAELSDAKLAPQILELAKRIRFEAEHSVLEIRGACANCQG
jgi:Fur family zinc uptake transcriptional regulator